MNHALVQDLKKWHRRCAKDKPLSGEEQIQLTAFLFIARNETENLAVGASMKRYKFRLTVTLKTQEQWKIGIELEHQGMEVAQRLKGLDKLANICLSNEMTGTVIWLRKPEDL